MDVIPPKLILNEHNINPIRPPVYAETHEPVENSVMTVAISNSLVLDINNSESRTIMILPKVTYAIIFTHPNADEHTAFVRDVEKLL